MQQHWNALRQSVEAEIGSAPFNTWIRPLRLFSSNPNSLTVAVPNNWYREWVQANYLQTLQNTLRQVSGNQSANISLVIEETAPVAETEKESPATAKEEAPPSPTTSPGASGVQLNPRYRFESFVVGASNQFAHAASLAVSDSPGKNYNPLFIYGGVGLGKTHLLTAIGQRLFDARPGIRVFYRTAERFMNELITCLRNKTMSDFRNKYRNHCDVLLIDDIQFLAGKETTQEEFFHTFNALYEMGKQIVLTSDKFPKQIPDLEERLRSRFEWGLIADIQPPETETRIAILKKKAESEGMVLPDEVAIYLAGRIKSNIRELEGSLIRLEAYSSLHGVPVSLPLAEEVFRQLHGEDRPLTADDIQKTVANFFNIKVADLKSPRKQKIIALPRQIAMYLCRKHTEMSYPEIGARFGGKDHTTIIHAVKKIEKMMGDDPTVKNAVESVEKNLQFAR